ncbi:MAG: beta-propeller domain-containing protein [Gammaproteobacteria bacterium]|nr:beta-propeller domain-containing protein [Gammaproteobacteria bacterium]
MSKIKTILLLSLLPLLIISCDSFLNNTPQKTADNSTNNSFRLNQSNSNTELETYLKTALKQSTIYSDVIMLADNAPPAQASPAPSSATSAPTSGAANSSSSSTESGNYSSTNLWEKGIDEADRMKFDGQNLYVMQTSDLYFYDALPVATPAVSNSLSISPPSNPTSNETELRILSLSGAPHYNATEIKRLTLPWSANTSSNLYLRTQQEGANNSLLAALGGASGNDWQTPWGWQQGETQLHIYNVNTPASPVLRSHYSFDGYQISSRRIGSQLYLALRYTPSLPGFMPYPYTQDDELNNQQLIQNATLNDLLPKWRLNGKEQGTLANADNCYLIPSNAENSAPALITLLSINLDQADSAPHVSCITGSSQTLYLSSNALYLANPAYNYVDSSSHTTLHKFSLNNGLLNYSASGQIKGTLGWGDKASSHLSEHNGLLRVVSSSSNWNGNLTQYDHRLTVLKEQAGELIPVAQLPNETEPQKLGKPGEDIYAVRFAGDKLYLVTFQKTDPLYVIDLSDPQNPNIAGTLEIPGYSDYLHPINDQLVLGIGKEALLDASGNFSWYQGIKLGLFDISDISNPVEKKSIAIGKRGSDATVLNSHHGLAYLAATATTPARLALPINLHDASSAPSNPWEFYPWLHSGLYLFDIYDGQQNSLIDLQQQGILTAKTATSSSNPWGESINNDRALLLNDGVFYLHGNEIWSADWNSPTVSNGPQ